MGKINLKNEELESLKGEERTEAGLTESTDTIGDRIVDAPEPSPESEGAIPAKTRVPRLTSLFGLDTFQDERVQYQIFLPGASLTAPDGPIVTPLCLISDLLKAQGVPSINLRVALMSFLALNSAHTGYPIALEIGEFEDSGAVPLLTYCTNLTPKAHLIELPKVSMEVLMRERNQLKGRAIVGFHADSYRRESDLLSLLMERQSLKSQETIQGKYGDLFQEVELEGPTSCVLINRTPENPILKGPSFIRLGLSSELTEIVPTVVPIRDSEIERYRAWVRASMERLHPRAVEIPFMDQIVQHLTRARVKHVEQKSETLAKVLSSISIFNNPPHLYKSELYRRLLGYELMPKDTHSQEPETLTASKLDYSCLFSLMDGLWAVGDDSLNLRELRVFNAIKQWNLKSFEDSFLETGSGIEKLLHIAQHEKTWVPQDKIFELVNTDGGEPVSVSTIYRVLKNLTDKEVITTRTDSNSKTKKLFAITTLDVGENIRLPHPTQITGGDPTFSGKSVQVINPFTGALETI